MANILLVEDDESVRAFVERGLIAMGHQVTAVADGGKGLEKLQQHGFDLLITDIVLPVMDGIALALAASDTHPSLPILMMSGYQLERERAHNLNDLIIDVLAKPFTLAELTTAVTKALMHP
ncbi:MAG: response regulator [Rhodocyclaceae bacterium]|nr:response regulator [Rhodocyclaceae bacterium]